MRVSYGEMRRAAVDALRGLGLSFGQAEDAVEALLVTQAAFGRGYGLIRLAEAARDDSRPRPAPESTGKGQERIDLRGATLLPWAERIADLLRARHAAGDRSYRPEVVDTAGGWVLPQIARRLALAGIASRIEWAAPQGGHPDEAGSFLCFGGLAGRPPGQVMLAPWQAPAGAGGRAGIVTGPEAASPPPPGARMVDLDAALAGFIAEGLPVDAAEHAQWFAEIAARVRLPTSERSRTQAG